jgi:hypothetical protein
MAFHPQVERSWSSRAARRARHLALLVASLVALAGTAHAGAPDYSKIPYFKLPFPCGQQWRLSTHDGHNPEDRLVDFFRVDGGVEFGIGTTKGNAVLAAASGKVHQRPDPGGVEIDHGGGWFTLYLHMTGIIVNDGDKVYAGQKIGTVDKVGTNGDPHLHFELMYDGLQGPVDNDGDGGGKEDDWIDERVYPWFEGVQYPLVLHTNPEDDPKVTSTNACPSGGGPQAAVQYGTGYGYPFKDNLYSFAREQSTGNLIYMGWGGGWSMGNLAGSLAGAPAVALYNHQLQIVDRETDNRIRHRWYDPATSNWGLETFGGLAGGDLDMATVARTNQLMVVARDTGNHLFRWWYTPGTGWQAASVPNSSDVTIAGTPALATYSVATPLTQLPALDDFQIVARASDGAIWIWSLNTTTGTWQRAKTSGIATSDPAVAVYNNQLHIFVRGTDGKLWHMWRTPATAWASESFNVLPAGTPAAIVRNNELHVFVRTTAKTLVDCRYADGWSCGALPGQAISDPQATVYQDPYYTGAGNAQLQVTAAGTDGHMWHWWAGEGEPWGSEQLAVSIMPPETAPPPPWQYNTFRQLKNAQSGLCLVVQGSEDGSQAFMHDCSVPYADQLWVTRAGNGGGTEIANANSGDCLVTPYWFNYGVTQTYCDIYPDSKWEILDSGPTYRLRNVNLGTCLVGSTTFAYNATMAPCSSAQDQKWTQR